MTTFFGFSRGPMATPDVVNFYQSSGQSPNLITFEADYTGWYNQMAVNTASVEWQFSTTGSGPGPWWPGGTVPGSFVRTGPTTMYRLASGTVAARCKVWDTGTGDGTEWVYSSLVAFTRPAALQIEVPAGSINGTNMTFTTAYSPPSGTFGVFLRGQLQPAGGSASYTASGNSITFNNSATYQGPQSGDPLYVIYSA